MNRFASRWLPAWRFSFLLWIIGVVGCGPAPPRREFSIPVATQPTSVNSLVEPFWWGVSVASYQTEEPPAAAGFTTDWDLLSRAGKCAGRDGRVASYSHFPRDLAALKSLGVTHYRFSIEWARVEPRPGQFDEAAIEHYVEMARLLRENGITPVVCLWHFSLPDWLCDFQNPERHGWLNPGAGEAWAGYVRKVVPRLAPYVQLYAPQNEPNAYALGVCFGAFPPGRLMSAAYFDRIILAEAEAFKTAAGIIRSADPDAKIVSVQNIIHWERDPGDLFGQTYSKALEYNHGHLDAIAGTIDYLGFNYYQREVASIAAPLAQASRARAASGGEEVSDSGWLIDPDGLEAEIVDLSRRYGKPLVITENGVDDHGDRKRQLFLIRHLLAVRHARQAGYDVRGYFHWTLMDDYEWMTGYEPRMGLYSVAPGTKALVAKDSAGLYRSLIAANFVDAERGR